MHSRKTRLDYRCFRSRSAAAWSPMRTSPASRLAMPRLPGAKVRPPTIQRIRAVQVRRHAAIARQRDCKLLRDSGQAGADAKLSCQLDAPVRLSCAESREKTIEESPFPPTQLACVDCRDSNGSLNSRDGERVSLSRMWSDRLRRYLRRRGIEAAIDVVSARSATAPSKIVDGVLAKSAADRRLQGGQEKHAHEHRRHSDEDQRRQGKSGAQSEDGSFAARSINSFFIKRCWAWKLDPYLPTKSTYAIFWPLAPFKRRSAKPDGSLASVLVIVLGYDAGGRNLTPFAQQRIDLHRVPRAFGSARR